MKRPAKAARKPPVGVKTESATPDRAAWPASTVVLRAAKDLKPNPRNSNTHSKEQIDRLASSLKRWGFTKPILVDDDGMILAGHGTVEAAKLLGITSIPCAVATNWSEKDKRAVMIADNQLGRMSLFDEDVLRAELIDLKTDDFDFTPLGFDANQLQWMTEGVVVDDPRGEWAGMPEFDQQEKRSFRAIVVHFKDQASVDKFAKFVKQKIGPNIRYLWYPEAEIETYADKRYAAKARK